MQCTGRKLGDGSTSYAVLYFTNTRIVEFLYSNYIVLYCPAVSKVFFTVPFAILTIQTMIRFIVYSCDLACENL